MFGKCFLIYQRTSLTKVLLFSPFLLILSTVFIINDHLANGVISGKYFWFYGSMGMVSIVTLIHSFTNKQSFRFTILDGVVFLFVGSILFSSLVINDASQNKTKLFVLALLVVCYFSLRIVLQKGIAGQAHNGIIIFFILTGLVETVWGLLQLYGFKPSQHALFKLTGSFFNPGPYAGYLAVVFPMALHYWVNGKRYTVHDERYTMEGTRYKIFGFRVSCTVHRVPQIIAAITCITIILVLPASMSRASWLAVIAGSIVVVAAHYWNKLRVKNEELKVKNRRLNFSLFILISSLLTFNSFVGLYYLKKDSADGRLLAWKVSLTALAKHPFGVGLGHFPSAYGDTQAAYFASGKTTETEEYVAGNLEYGFNEFLQIAIESGLISFCLFIGMIIFAFRGLVRNKNWSMMGSLVALLVFACFSYPFSVLPFPIILVFLLAMSDTNGTRIKRITSDINNKSAIISAICAICVLLILYKQYPVYKAYKQWNNSRIYYQTGMYKEAAIDYETLYPYLNDQIQFLFEYGRSLSQSEHLEKSNEVLQQSAKISCDPMLYNIMGKNYQAMKKYDLAEQYLLKSTHIVPDRLYPYYLLMKLYVEMGDKQKARETAGIVLTKEAKVQSQAVKEMREEAKKIEN